MMATSPTFVARCKSLYQSTLITAKANPAMTLTVMRIALIPLFVLAFYLPFSEHRWVAWGIFATASITDYFDGHLARKYGWTSTLGAFLDPVADKLLVAVVLIALVSAHPTFLMILGAMIIIVREIGISALREFMASAGKRDIVAVNNMGKIKTFAQIFALGFLIIYQPVGFIPTAFIGYALLVIASALTLWSMIAYFRVAIKHL